MSTTATAHLTIGGSPESVRADAVTIHRVTADDVTVTEIAEREIAPAFTSIDIATETWRTSHLFVHGTPGERATELLRIAHVLTEAAELLAAENAEQRAGSDTSP